MQASGPRPPVIARRLIVDVVFLEVDRFGAAVRARAIAQPLRHAIDRDDALGAEQIRALDRELAHRPAAPDGDGVAGLDVAVLGGHVTGREDVGEEQHLLVGQRVRAP